MVMMKMKRQMKNRSVDTIGVIGAGSWGTALADVLSSKGYLCYLCGHRQEHIDALLHDQENKKYLPGAHFNSTLVPTTDIEKDVKKSQLVVLVVPSQIYRSVFQKILRHVSKKLVVVSATKGIENDSLYTMTQVMEEEIEQSGSSVTIELGVLSGPSFAREVVDGVPTAVTIGAKDIHLAMWLQKIFVTESFRVYASGDVIGLEISAAFKNIIAIATGICDGLGYGLNTRAALITRGLAEIARIGAHLGADPMTFSGLSGMGDLILTCTGDLSRNRSVGLELGKGKSLDEILHHMHMVAEGVKTTLSAYKLAKLHNVDMPILEQVYKILYCNKDSSSGVKDLLQRQLKIE